MKLHFTKHHRRQTDQSATFESLVQPSHPVLGHGQDGAQQVPLTLAEATEHAKAHHEYIVPVHIVFLPRANTQALPEPAQIPWLAEIHSDQYLSDLRPEII